MVSIHSPVVLWQIHLADTFFVIFISTHHLELPIDLVLLEDLLVLLLHLQQDGVDEVVAVGCNRPNLEMMM